MSGSQSTMAQSSYHQRPRKCYHCGWYGHIARFCQYSQTETRVQETSPEHVAAEVGVQNYEQSRRPPPLWHPQHHPTYDSQQVHPHAFPPTPTSPYWPSNEAPHTAHLPRKSPYSQVHPLAGLPTPSSPNFPSTVSQVSPADEYDHGGQTSSPYDHEEDQERSDEDSIDLQALDYPESCIPHGVPSFPTLQIAEPLAASMEMVGALGPSRSAHSLPTGVPVSNYFHDLVGDMYYRNISEKRDWGAMCHDPAFSFLDINSHTISFADLHAGQASNTKHFEDEEPIVDAKFDIICLHQDTAEVTAEQRLSDEQEARLAALGVSGSAIPADSDIPHVALHLPIALSQEVPPWWRNEDSRYSRYFPGPSHATYQSSAGYRPENTQRQSNGYDGTLTAPDSRATSSRKRSRASDFFNDTEESDLQGLGTKIRRTSNQSLHSASDSVYSRRW